MNQTWTNRQQKEFRLLLIGIVLGITILILHFVAPTPKETIKRDFSGGNYVFANRNYQP